MNEIIIQLTEHNSWLINVAGEKMPLIATEFSTKISHQEEKYLQLRVNTYMLCRFIYWLKSKEIQDVLHYNLFEELK